jgi:mycothiol S-conjugate amidase
MNKARSILGVRQAWLGFVDSGLPEGDPLPPLPEGCFGLIEQDEAVGALVAQIREHRPHVMTTYDENGGYPHPDHIMCHKISVAAFDAAGDPDRYPEAGAPWQPLKLYYNLGFNKQRVTALHEGMLAEGLESPYAEWLEKWEDRPDRADRVTTRIPCGDYFEVRDDALRAHATQVDPEGFWFRVPLEVQRKVWPTEEFELARSLVESADGIEDDLFAGIRDSVSA